MPFPVTAQATASAIKVASQIGAARKKELNLPK